MSPSFVNDNSHAIRVRDEDGKLARVLPQQVVDADGKYADNLERTNGVRTANDEDRETWESIAGPSEGGKLFRRDASARAAEARVDARRVSIVGPLQRVVGDSSAPYGPPTGTITTKQALVEGLDPGDPDRQAFADHEAVEPTDATDERADLVNPAQIPTEPQVHNTQHDNFVAAGEAAELLLAEDEGNGGNGGNGEAQGPKQEPKGKKQQGKQDPKPEPTPAP